MFFRYGQEQRQTELNEVMSTDIFEDPSRVLVPGYSFIVLGRPFWGWSIIVTYVVLLSLYIVFLGSNLSDNCGTSAVLLHIFSAFRGMRSSLMDSSIGHRLSTYAATTAFLVFVIYYPAVHFGQGYWVLPLQRAGQPIVLSVRAPAKSVRLGDYVAYQMTRFSQDNVYIQSGISIDRVLALPGSTVRFFSDRYEVDGRKFIRLGLMPQEGEFVVPNRQWFIWPSLAVGMNHGVREDQVASALSHVMMVDQDSYRGKAFKRWFFRDQLPGPL
jgi:hypothetical protein